jgi:hypothetical protein
LSNEQDAISPPFLGLGEDATPIDSKELLMYQLDAQGGGGMDSLGTAFVVAAMTFAGGVAGLALQRLLPEDLASGALKDMIGAISGLLTLLTALVLGLLIWTAYGVFANQASAVRNLAIGILQLDLALSDYGPDAAAGRAQLRDRAPKNIEEIWARPGDSGVVTRSDKAAIANLRERQAYLNSLQPTTELQKQALAAANQAATSISQTRLQMALALTDPISRPLIFIVVAWSTFIFVGFGFMHGGHLSTIFAVAIGAIAVAAAVYLVLDLSEPYSGIFEVSPKPLQQALEQINKPP